MPNPARAASSGKLLTPASADEAPRRLLWVAPLALLLAWLLSLTPAYQRLSLALVDSQLRLAWRDTPRSDVAVVDIDEASIRALRSPLGAWPYRRDTYALLADHLLELGARLVVFDIVFADARDGDAPLARSVERNGRVLLAAAALHEAADADPGAPQLGQPLPAQWPHTAWPALRVPTATLLGASAASATVGVVSVQPDDDSRLRRLPLLHAVDGRALPSLPLAVLQTLQPGTPLEYADGRYRLGAHRWPVDQSGRIAFKLPAREALTTTPFQRVAVSALGITDDPLLGEQVAGRVVFVGSSAFASEQLLVQRVPRPDVRLLAAATSALAADEVLSPPSRALDGLLIVIALLPALSLWRRARPDAPVDTLLALAALAAIWMIGTLALAAARVQSHTSMALTVVAVAWALALWQYVGYMQHANRRLASERAAADAASRARSEFVARVSQEIRNPMHSLLGMAEQLAGTPLDAGQRRRVEGLRASGRTLLEFVDDLADLSKIDARRLELKPSLFSLPDLLAAVSALMRPQAAQQGLTWTVQVEPGLKPGAWCDPQRLQQVLLNLAGNALKFTTQGGIMISVRRDPKQPEMLHFAVADTGIGIAASKHPSIFEPYVQADGVITLNHGATGLGLAITKRLVEMMGGDIRIESAPGMGATFLFTVLAPPRALQEALGASGEVAAPRAASEPLTTAPVPARTTTTPARPALNPLAHLDASGVVDAAAACDRLGNDVSLYRRRLAHAQVFLADWPIFFRASRQLGEPDQAARLADDLTGIAATIGAQPLSDAARDLERAMRTGAASTEVDRLVDPVLERLQHVVLALSRAFEAEIAATNGPSGWPARER